MIAYINSDGLLEVIAETDKESNDLHEWYYRFHNPDETIKDDSHLMNITFDE